MKKQPKTAYPLILVKWEDHTASAAWETHQEAKDSPVAVFQTVGYLVHEDKKKIVVCQCIELGGDKLVGNRSTIVKKCILSRHEIDLRD